MSVDEERGGVTEGAGVETSVNEEGLPSSLVMKLVASKYNTSW